VSVPAVLLSRHGSPLGPLLAAHQGGELVALDFDDAAERLHAGLRRRLPACAVREGELPAAIARALDGYFDGELGALAAIPVRLEGTPFQRRVWEALRRIPAGHTASYAGLAGCVGAPRAARAVGRANALNPVSVVVPCHRVVGSKGALTGYAGGLARKRWLLAHERALA